MSSKLYVKKNPPALDVEVIFKDLNVSPPADVTSAVKFSIFARIC